MRGLEETNDFEEETFTAIAGRGVTYGAQHFEHCTFERCDFGEARFEDCRFYDCTFDRCDLSMMKAPRSAFREVNFKGSKVMGVDWQQAKKMLFEVTFEDCDLSYCTFVGHRLRGMTVSDSRAREVDFSQCDLTSASFANTDLTGARFYRTKLHKTDFGEAENLIFSPRDNHLEDTRIALDTGIELLGRMGFVL